jgi:histidyl-tRNA synthetase
MSNKLITPQTLKGFRDYLPDVMLQKEKLIEIARRVYRSYGFSPIDTPALEYSEILLGKGSDETDKQMFRFTDNGDRDVSLRFDLTIPFARFAAKYIGELGTPFKRYHIGTVWRAEKPQAGRYREFMQCDFDIIGTDSNASDIETLLVINDLIEQLGVGGFTIRVNHRQLLNGMLEKQGLLEHSVAVLRALDKLAKIGPNEVIKEMGVTAGATPEKAQQILEFAGLTGTPDEMLDRCEELVAGNERGLLGIANLRELFAAASAVGLPVGRVKLDLSIARGLDYYTGTIFETFLDALPKIGSVCSGGRYDNLAELFTKQKLPGVGASLGLDRLLAAMEELGQASTSRTPAPILITQFDAKFLPEYLKMSRELRAAGIGVEVYPEAKGIGRQFKYADRKGFTIVLIAGENEFNEGKWQVKHLASGSQQVVESGELVKVVGELLGN